MSEPIIIELDAKPPDEPGNYFMKRTPDGPTVFVFLSVIHDILWVHERYVGNMALNHVRFKDASWSKRIEVKP